MIIITTTRITNKELHINVDHIVCFDRVPPASTAQDVGGRGDFGGFAFGDVSGDGSGARSLPLFFFLWEGVYRCQHRGVNGGFEFGLGFDRDCS